MVHWIGLFKPIIVHTAQYGVEKSKNSTEIVKRIANKKLHNVTQLFLIYSLYVCFLRSLLS